MFNNYYGLRRDGDGGYDDFDQFMTVGKDKKWDYEKTDESSLRIFNPTNNDTILTVNLTELESYFSNEIDINIDDCWDEMTEFVSGSCLRIISDYYNK